MEKLFYICMQVDKYGQKSMKWQVTLWQGSLTYLSLFSFEGSWRANLRFAIYCQIQIKNRRPR